MTHNRITEFLAQELVATTLIPWACPSSFGPDDRYRLEEVVAVTPHSLVYRATDLRLSEEGFEASVAVKVHRSSPTSRLREAKLQRRIRHPHVLGVLDWGIADNGLEYCVTEFVDGVTLGDMERPKLARDAARIVEKIARGVQAAHTAGICHLDLKPANVLMTAEGEPKVADFGLAGVMAESACEQAPGRGNLAFMAPEQYLGSDHAQSPAADIYALGGLLYWLLSGQLPSGVMEEEISRAHREGRARAAPCGNRTLSAICLRALSHSPSDRQHSAGELADDVQAWLESRPVSWMRPSLARVCSLWTSRHKVLASVMMLGAAGTMGAATTAWVMRAKSYEQELRVREDTIDAQREAQRLADLKIEDLRSRMRQSLRTFANTMFASTPANMPSSLVWLTYFNDLIMVDEKGERKPPEELVRMLEGIVVDKTITGAGASVECLMARHALAFVYIQTDDEVSARVQLSSIRRTWGNLIAPSDPIWRDIGALEECVVAMSRSGENTAEEQRAARDAVRAWASKAEADGPIDRLAQELLRRMEAARKQ